jgi:hypothetical protein
MVDSVKRNIEKYGNLISHEAILRLSAGFFAGLRHVFRGDCSGWAVWIRTGPQHRQSSIVWVSGTAYAFADRATCVEKSEKRTAFADRPGVVVGWWDDHDFTGPISSSEPSSMAMWSRLRPRINSDCTSQESIRWIDLRDLTTASRAQTILRRRSCQVVQ